MNDVPQYNPVPAPKKFPFVPVIAGVVAVAVVAGGILWYRSTRSSSVDSSPTPSAQQSLPPGAAVPAQWAHVKFQAREQISDGKYFPQLDPTFVVPETHWKVGTFTEGPYKGSNLILAQVSGEMGGDSYFRFAKNGEKLVFLARNSDQYWPGMRGSPFLVDDDYAIGELTPPLILQNSNGSIVLERGSVAFYTDGFWEDQFARADLMKAFTDSRLGDIWTDKVPQKPTPTPTPYIEGAPSTPEYIPRYGFYARLADGTAITYTLKVPFIKDEYADVVFTQGNGGNYIAQEIGGCGFSNFLNVIPRFELDPAKELKEGGRTGTGDKVYVLQNTNHPILRTIYDTQYQPIYPSTDKLNYNQYIDLNPVFFWYDPMGRLVQFQNKMFLPQAECGKPVIYLYPEKTQEVSVKVEPQGGMSVSDPDYGTGWLVTAQPNGQILDHGTNKTFPYLFWEGRGGIYERPDRGWVVPQPKVKSLIDEKLKAFGLNAQEIADFQEYWLPKMKDAPYYFITFMGNRTMDALAPLTIDPKPDTVIRVLMDYEALQKPRPAEGFNIRTPERRGFTVVEWGGVLGR